MPKSDKKLHVHSCRVCLNSTLNQEVKITERNGWFPLFEYCFGISLSSEDQPQYLCRKCAYHVKKYSKFKKLCHKSDKLWKSITNALSVKIESHQQIKSEQVDEQVIVNDFVDDDEENFTYAEQFLCEVKNNTDDLDTLKVNNENEQNADIKDFIEDEELSDNNEYDTGLLTEDSTVENLSKKSIMNGKMKYTCETCQKQYGSSIWYAKHIKSCEPLKIEENTDEANADTNGSKCDKQDRFIASECSKESSNKNNKLHFCGVCKYTSSNVDDVLKHWNEHWSSNTLHCVLCEFTAKDVAAIATHRYKHLEAGRNMLSCHMCQKKFKSQLSLEFHYRKIHLNKAGGLCSEPKCDKTFSALNRWKSHEKRHYHPGYVCDFCGKKYRHKHLIVEHLQLHLNPTTHICDVCGKTFLRLRNMRLHINMMHVNSERLKCTHCNNTYKNEFYLKKHQKLMKMEKIFKCDFCPMEYPRLCLLKCHLVSHSQERPFACGVCGASYKLKSHLVVHMRNHTGDRPYKCETCAKEFKSSNLLRIHKTMHTANKPHKCTHCEKSFATRCRLKQHCTTRHKTSKDTK